MRSIAILFVYAVFLSSHARIRCSALKAVGGAYAWQEKSAGLFRGLAAVNQTMVSKEGEFLTKELLDVLIRNASNSSVDDAARNVLNAGMTAFTKKVGLGKVHNPKSAVVRLGQKRNSGEPDPLDGDAILLGAGVPMRLFTVPGINSSMSTAVTIAAAMDWFFSIDLSPFVIHPCVGLSIHLVSGPFEPREFGGIDGFVSYARTQNVPGASFSFDFNPSFVEDLLKSCFKRAFTWSATNAAEYKKLFTKSIAGSHLSGSDQKHVYRIASTNAPTFNEDQQFLKELGAVLPGAMLSKVTLATYNAHPAEGSSKWTCGEDVSVNAFMSAGSDVLGHSHYCVELVTQRPDCGGGISPINQYLANFAAQSSLGFELVHLPGTFAGGTIQPVQAPYLAFCLYGTTQGGLCGMKIEAYREDAMKDAAFSDDATSPDLNLPPPALGRAPESKITSELKSRESGGLKENLKHAIKSSTFDLAPYGYTWCSKEGLVDDWSKFPGTTGQTTAAALLGSAMAFQSLFQPLRDWFDSITGFGESDNTEWTSHEGVGGQDGGEEKPVHSERSVVEPSAVKDEDEETPAPAPVVEDGGDGAPGGKDDEISVVEPDGHSKHEPVSVHSEVVGSHSKVASGSPSVHSSSKSLSKSSGKSPSSAPAHSVSVHSEVVSSHSKKASGSPSVHSSSKSLSKSSGKSPSGSADSLTYSKTSE